VSRPVVVPVDTPSADLLVDETHAAAQDHPVSPKSSFVAVGLSNGQP